MRTLLASVAAAAMLAGCGLKGPLYLPADKPAPKQPAKSAPSAPATGAGPSS